MNNNASVKRVELLKPHEHAKRQYPVGGVLTLPARKADWLVGCKVAKELDGDGSAAPVLAAPTPEA